MKHTTEMKTPAQKLEKHACCELFQKMGTESTLVEHELQTQLCDSQRCAGGQTT